METLELKTNITLDDILVLIPSFVIEYDKKNMSEREGDVWKKVLTNTGYDPNSKVIGILYDITQTEEYKQILRKAREDQKRLNERLRSDLNTRKTAFKVEDGIPHPGFDVTDPHFLREKGGFPDNY